MSNFDDNSHRVQAIFSAQHIVLAGSGWAVLALLYFLLFSAKTSVGANGAEIRDQWYQIGTYIFEAVAYLSAFILCLRNWLSPQIVSSRSIWLSIGLGMLSYFIGGIIFDYQEIAATQEAEVSIGDVFFVTNYICLGIGMVLAVISRRINLSKWQWVIVATIAVSGSLFAWWISQQQEATSNLLALVLSRFYIISDLFLLIMATTLLLAFWGGKISWSWQLIAAATFSLYIADMWFAYAQGDNYQSGDILEVFWVFSGVFFGMGAVLEYDASLNRTRRIPKRKRS